MSKSVISIGSNFEPTHNIRRALEALDVEAVSRVFLTSAQPPGSGIFHNLVVVAGRKYAQEELYELEQQIGRNRGTKDTSHVPIDLDLQFTGNWESKVEGGRFSIAEPHRMDWANDFFVRLPTVDLFATIVPPIAPNELPLPAPAPAPCRERVLGAFPVEKMPLLEGGFIAHRLLMSRVIDFLRSRWAPGEYPGAAAVILNGAPVAQSLLFREPGRNPDSRAESFLAIEAMEKLGGARLAECTIYSTHEPCAATLARCRALGIRGFIWAADAADAPELYGTGHVSTLAACRGDGSPLMYRGVLREDVLRFSRERAGLVFENVLVDATGVLPLDPVQQWGASCSSSASHSHSVAGGLHVKHTTDRPVTTRELYDAAANEYLDAEAHPVATTVACIQWNLRKMLADDSTGPIADIGCGSELPPVSGRFMGVDLSTNQIAERTRKAPNELSVVGDAHALPFRSGSFGALFSGNMLDHMSSLEDAAEEFSRVLAPGGKAVISLLCPDSLPDDLYQADTMRFRTIGGDTYTTPITRWRSSEIREAFGKHFEILDEERIPVGVRDFALSVFRLTKAR